MKENQDKKKKGKRIVSISLSDDVINNFDGIIGHQSRSKKIEGLMSNYVKKKGRGIL